MSFVSKDNRRDYRGARVKRTTVTAIKCISANGRSLLPMIIWPAQNLFCVHARPLGEKKDTAKLAEEDAVDVSTEQSGSECYDSKLGLKPADEVETVRTINYHAPLVKPRSDICSSVCGSCLLLPHT